MKITFFLSLLSVLLISCSGTNDSIEQDRQSIEDSKKIEVTTTIKDGSKNGQQKNIKISYDKSLSELKIWNITVKEWLPEKLPTGLDIPKNSKSYINSNVEDYYFLFTPEGKANIFTSYRKSLLANKWREIQKEKSDIYFNEDIITFKRGYQTVTIQFFSNIPENLLSLQKDGNYIEISYY